MRLKLVLFLHPHVHLPSSHPFADQEGFAVFVYGCIVRPETLSSGLASAELTFSVPPSSPWSMKQGRRVSWPSTSTPAGPPTWPPVFAPSYPLYPSGHQTCLLPAPCNAWIVFWVMVTQLQREARSPTTAPGELCSSSDSDVLSLFIFFSIGSIFSPRLSWPPAWLPFLCPFCNSA